MMIFEENYTVSHFGTGLGSYREISELPTYKRRAMLHSLAKDAKKQQEERDKMAAKAKNKASVKGRR